MGTRLHTLSNTQSDGFQRCPAILASWWSLQQSVKRAMGCYYSLGLNCALGAHVQRGVTVVSVCLLECSFVLPKNNPIFCGKFAQYVFQSQKLALSWTILRGRSTPLAVVCMCVRLGYPAIGLPNLFRQCYEGSREHPCM